jgi:penicillin-binding protein 1C
VTRRRGTIWRGLAALVLVGVVGLATGHGVANRILAEVSAGLPPVPDPAHVAVSTLVRDRHGELLRAFTTPLGRWRLPVEVADVDPRFLAMLIGYEDRGFYGHRGVDWGAMARALWQYLAAGGEIVSGGSTLSMQVARLVDGGSTRALPGKLRQMLLADQIDHALGKDALLKLYLTLAPYGGNIEGVRAASLAYFGKEPRRLTVAEAALLVALPQSPEARRPDRDPVAALEARNLVLDRLAGRGVLTRDEADAAKADPLPGRRSLFPLLAAHLSERARANAPEAPVLDLTLDARLQRTLEALALARAARLGPKLSVAIVVADLHSGDILASVGSADYLDQQSRGFVDMSEAVRSPGSTLKPLIYGLAFELGLAHPESLIEDRPTGFGTWVPENFDGLSRGTVTIRDALTQSLNVPAMVVLDAVGLPRFMSRLQRAGTQPHLPKGMAPGLAIGLGGVGLTLRDLVGLYGALARGGVPLALHDGSMASPRLGAAPVLDPLAAFYVTDVLAGVPPPINGTPGRIAYKTGTSYGYRDGWAIGYDGGTVIGVWVGRADGSPVPGLSGISAAAPILFESFDRLGHPLVPLPKPPKGALFAGTADLPGPLQRFRHPDDSRVARDTGPEIAFPADGVEVDLGLARGAPLPLRIKLRNGSPPFTYLANGAPLGPRSFARDMAFVPDGAGFQTLSVIDAAGRTAVVTVFVD